MSDATPCREVFYEFSDADGGVTEHLDVVFQDGACSADRLEATLAGRSLRPVDELHIVAACPPLPLCVATESTPLVTPSTRARTTDVAIGVIWALSVVAGYHAVLRWLQR